MIMVNSVKKTMVMILLFLMTFMSVGAFMSTKAHATAPATNGGDISDVNVTFDPVTGKMTVAGGNINSGGTSADAWTKFINKYRNFIVGISAIGMVSMILFFVFNFMKLGATAGNARARQEVITGLVWSGVAAAGLGSVTTFVGFFYGALK